MLPRPSQPVAPFLRIFYDWDLLGVAVEGRTEAQGSAQAFLDAHMIEPLGLARCGFSGNLPQGRFRTQVRRGCFWV